MALTHQMRGGESVERLESSFWQVFGQKFTASQLAAVIGGGARASELQLVVSVGRQAR